ncbi:MAG: hypothetical protein GTO42_08705 [Candidatus Latescibacteria bacterium]|nr:hypothetical protein [Candidatus Latescibacterota bacterium]NIO29040.1 hypothetical protein [Candidatus Latescibacterota bacterium]NIO56665.1 hypothetical protein [Candidatus Latescibacterota bacterium]NIT02248.1 hypothetical protein [Candidatus Latescibacterota bacterium]NIT39133.1 hypothetical protein [Candidatus Latescibacterota bacterium]
MPVVESELPKEIAGVTVKIKCTGFIHDVDFISADDEESFSIEHTINLIPDHPSAQISRSTQIVGGEVRLDMLLAMKATKEGIVSVSGSFELWEGLIWNRTAHERIAESLIPSPGSITVYDGRIDDKKGDYADVKLVVEAIPYLKPEPQEPKKN